MIQATVEVLSVREETPSVRSIRVARPQGFTFEASQSVRLTVGGQTHPFSIASSPLRRELEFAARQTGSEFKRAFFALRPGETVGILGPRGDFLLEPSEPAILVAAGIGITPLKSMIEYVADARLGTPMTLVYGNRSAEEIAFREPLEALTRTMRRFELVHTISQPRPGWPGRVGRIDAALLGEVSASLPGAIHYIAGPAGLVDDTVQTLLALEVAPERIRVERFRGYPGNEPAPGGQPVAVNG
jgi:ferredoxin-NADP reductase